MSLNRREFIQLMGIAAAAGLVPGCDSKQQKQAKSSTGAVTNGVLRKPEDLYNIPKFGNVSIMHMTDYHA